MMYMCDSCGGMFDNDEDLATVTEDEEFLCPDCAGELDEDPEDLDFN